MELLIAKGAETTVQSKNVACSSLLHHYASRGNVRALKLLHMGKLVLLFLLNTVIFFLLLFDNV